MAEYIKKWPVVDKLTALENELQQYKPFRPCEDTMYKRICDIEIEIGKMDAEDVAPVVHGRWGMHSDRPDTLICSICDHAFDVWKHDVERMHYCPNCGAKMDGVSDG